MEKISLSDGERKLLSAIVNFPNKVEISELSRISGIPESTVNAIIELLKSKGLVREEVTYNIILELTPEGKKALEEGLPEEKLTSILLSQGAKQISELEGILGKKELQLSLGAARKRGVVDIVSGNVVLNKDKLTEISIDKEVLKRISSGKELTKEMAERVEVLLKRGLVKKEIKKVRKVEAEIPIAKKALETGNNVIVKLTSRDILSGRWKESIVKEYNVELLPPRVSPGLPHFYMLFIEKIKEALESLGFAEVNGPIIESEFWNFDALFQAQDHPSREIHDTFWVDLPDQELDAKIEMIERVKNIHETGGTTGSKGWRYRWNIENAARLILRTQMTAVSARTLASNPKPPFRFFAIGKVFRPDLIDSRHLPEFYQLDSILGSEDMSFSMLLGAIVEFFAKLGLKEVKFKPAYFPFTEPSVEGYVKIDPLGWVEVFGAGMFRPEVLEIAGISVPVGAWGMGLDRLAMALLRVDDIRKLYSKNIEELRKQFAQNISKLV